MRHHTTSIVGPDLGTWYAIESPVFHTEIHLMETFNEVLGRFQAADEAMLEICGLLTTKVEALEEWRREMTQDKVCPPDPSPYPSDLLAAIPWAKEASLRLVEAGRDTIGGKWLYVMPSHYYNDCAKEWCAMRGMNLRHMFGYYPTRAAALKLPPPKPPGFVEVKAKAVDTSYDGGDSRSGPGVPPPAQPSVGEKLGEVAWRASGNNEPFVWNQQDNRLQESYRNIALAVRREVLKEVFAEEDVEAAAKAMWNATLPGITWDELREASRKPIRVQADAALSAALASRAARAEREDRQ